MQKLIIFAALAACCVAAPTLRQDDVKTLPRPSPINPAVISDPKPDDGTPVIKVDPKDLPKTKRESGNPPQEQDKTHQTPTIAPAHHAAGHNQDDHHAHEDHHDHKDTTVAHDVHHPRAKREDKKNPVAKSASATTPAPKAPAPPKSGLAATAGHAPPKGASVTKAPAPKRTRKATGTTAAPPTKKTVTTPTKKSAPAPTKKTAPAPTKKSAPVATPVPQKHRQKRDDSNVQPSSTAVQHAVAAPLRLTDDKVVHPDPVVAQPSSAHLPEAAPSIAPVRHQHIGALFHAARSQELAAATHDVPHGGHAATSPPTVGAQSASHTVEKRYPDLSGGHPATSFPIPSSTPAAHTDAKRDIPVPLVPKHQHPEESPKEDEKKDEQQKDEKHNDEKKGDIQVEDLSEKAPGIQRPQQHLQALHGQEHHQQQKHEFHPQQQQHLLQQHSSEDAQAAVVGPTSLTASSTEHPVVRHIPVPVAELFARPKPQSEN